jgi:RNA polymerase sigma-70 factor (ECF subfamily)
MDREAAFREAVDAHYQALFRYALSLSQNEPDASDLVQQTYAIYARKGHQLRDPLRVKAWLFTTLRREFFATRRRSARFSDDPNEVAALPAVDIQRLDGIDGETLMAALGRLPVEYREPLTLFYLEEHSYQAIATLLEIPIGTVMSRLSRAKARLRKLLNDD